MKNTKPILKVIIKTEPRRNGGGIILFFPGEPANKYNINYYGSAYFPVVGELRNPCYGEADFDYYRECKPYKGPLVNKLLERMAADPKVGEDYVVRQAFMVTSWDRHKMWDAWRKDL